MDIFALMPNTVQVRLRLKITGTLVEGVSVEQSII